MASTTPSTSRKDSSASTRRALVAAALRLFTEHGYAAASLDTIVAEAEVTKGALYHHFSGKQDLFRAVYAEVERGARERVQGAVAEHEEPWAQALAGLHAFLEVAQEQAYGRVIVRDAPAVLGPDIMEEENLSTFETVASLVRNTLVQDDGEADDAFVDTLSRILYSTLSSAGIRVARSDDPVAESARVESAVILLFGGLRQVTQAPGGVDAWLAAVAAGMAQS